MGAMCCQPELFRALGVGEGGGLGEHGRIVAERVWELRTLTFSLNDEGRFYWVLCFHLCRKILPKTMMIIVTECELLHLQPYTSFGNLGKTCSIYSNKFDLVSVFF